MCLPAHKIIESDGYCRSETLPEGLSQLFKSVRKRVFGEDVWDWQCLDTSIGESAAYYITKRKQTTPADTVACDSRYAAFWLNQVQPFPQSACERRWR